MESKPDHYAGPSEITKAITELKTLFPAEGRVSTDHEILRSFGSSENSYHESRPHSVVVQVLSTEDVVGVVNVAMKWKVPVVPYSGATSLEGHFSGVSHGPLIILGFSFIDLLQV